MSKPILLGILADIQYAEKVDKRGGPGHSREYSKILGKTAQAVKYMNALNVDSCIHLGDIVDGNDTVETTRADLDAVLSHLSSLEIPIMHVLGNHCLDVGRVYLEEKLNLQSGPYYYKDFSEKWRVIVLDTVDVSVVRPMDHPYRERALEYLKTHKDEINAQDWNGTVGPEQVNWLQNLLRDATEAGKFVVICGHIPFLPQASNPMHVAWDNSVFLDLLRVYNAVVKAYFCGHDHSGGYAVNDGVHHVTFESVVDSRSGVGAHGVVELHDDHIVIRGEGDMTSRTLTWSPQQ